MISDSILDIILTCVKGSNSLEIIATDSAGNITSQIIIIEIIQPPVNEIDAPIADEIYITNNIPFKGRVDENNFSNASYVLNGETSKALNQEWDEELFLENGDYQLIGRSEDMYGEGDSDTLNFSVDKPSALEEFGQIEEHLFVYPIQHLNIFTSNTLMMTINMLV